MNNNMKKKAFYFLFIVFYFLFVYGFYLQVLQCLNGSFKNN